MSLPAADVRCSGMIFEHYHHRQCIHPGKVLREGKMYCGTHDPVAIKAREDKRNARWDAERAADRARWAEASRKTARAELCVAACEGVSDGDVKRLTNINRCDIMDFIARSLSTSKTYDESS